MISYRTFLPVALLFAFAATALAQEPTPPGETPKPGDPPPGVDVAPPADDRPRVNITLEECLRMSLDANLDLLYARMEPGLFEADLLAFRGQYDPIAYAAGSRSHSKSPTASSLSGASVLHDDLWAATVGVKGTWLLGTTYDINFDSQRSKNNNSFSTLNPRWDSSVGFSLRQPLLRNAWIDTQLISARITKFSHLSSISRVSQTTSETLYAVEFAYWTLVNAIRQKAVRQASLDVSQRLYEVNRNKVKAGALAPIEELRAESEVASQKEGIILATNDIENAMDGLRKLIVPYTGNQDWDTVLVPTDEPAFEPQQVDVGAAVDEALATRPELDQIRNTIQSGKLNEKRYEREMLPTLDLIGSLRYAGLGHKMGRSLDGIHSSDFDTYELGFVFEYPIGSRTAKGQRLRAEYEWRRSEVLLRNQEQAVVLEVRSAARLINSAAERIEATRTAVRLAERAEQAERARFDRGLTTSHNLLQFVRDMTAARSNEATAVTDYRIAQLELRKATGRLLRDRADQR